MHQKVWRKMAPIDSVRAHHQKHLEEKEIWSGNLAMSDYSAEKKKKNCVKFLNMLLEHSRCDKLLNVLGGKYEKTTKYSK